MNAWLRRPGSGWLVGAIAAAIVLYSVTIGFGLVNYDDPWLIGDNWIVHSASLSSLRRILFDLSSETRFVLGAEYLPARDVSVMIDHAIWGGWYGGYHLTNVVLYVGAIVAWFAAMTELGVDRRTAGVMVLLWAIHPAHAESVTWLTERKGVLAAALSGASVLGYARYRAGGSARWLALAAGLAISAVWSKALGGFAIAAIAGFEIVLPERRQSWRRSLTGLAVIAAVGCAAFLPVLVVASDQHVVGQTDLAPAGWGEMALGLHGFYLRIAAMTVTNAPTYPIASDGPTALDLVLGTIGVLAIVSVIAIPARGRWRPPPALRAAAVLWLACWFPVSRLVLPLHNVLVSDRYLLLPTLGTCLAVAVLLDSVPRARLRWVLLGAIVLASGVRTLGAITNWHDSATLWQSAVASNPNDGKAWSMYADATAEGGDLELAQAIVREGLTHTRDPRLLMRDALILIKLGERGPALQAMRIAAEAGEPRAMTNLGLMLLEEGRTDEALTWVRRGSEVLPMYAAGLRARGKVALAAGLFDEARRAFEHGYAIEPTVTNRYNLGLVLLQQGLFEEARVLFEGCVDDPVLGPRARAALQR